MKTSERITLDDFDLLLDPLPSQHDKGATPSERASTNQNGDRPFDPHAGGDDVPQVMKDEIADELRRGGFFRHGDGRIRGPCPFPGHTGHHVNFYYSPISGRWWCFGENHPGRDLNKTCVAGGTWSLWTLLFPRRRSPGGRNPSSRNGYDVNGESSASSHRSQRGGEGNNSGNLYDPPLSISEELYSCAPRHKRTADLLRSVGRIAKADDEEHCGIPLKGKCNTHSFVREIRKTGKTCWCAGCNTETSLRYLNVTFPPGNYLILRLRKQLDQLRYDAAEIESGVWEIDPVDGEIITLLISAQLCDVIAQFKRVQRRFKKECLAWHFAVSQEGSDGLSVEFQVLVRHDGNPEEVLKQLTGGTRKKARFQPDTVVRWDYTDKQLEQVRRDWATVLKCTLLQLDTECLFRPIFEALDGVHLTQPYGDLRGAYSDALEVERNGEGEDIRRCPVLLPDGAVCDALLAWLMDPDNRYPINPIVYEQHSAHYRRQHEPQGQPAGV